ncbi:MAG: M23 family metallopeptidase [Oscillospiraceae bacterium]|nr:M23 family metallopeptidase [Oscillospiraceae bacterium]
MNFFKDGKLPGKGTAAVICFCLAAVVALGIFSYNRSARELAGELSGLAENGGSSVTAAQTEDSENANAPAENVPMETEAENADAPAENVPVTPMAQDPFSSVNEPDGNIADNIAVGSDGASRAVIKPVNGDIINNFSDGELVKSKTLSVWKTHDGIDVAADVGTAVKSMTTGVITDISNDPLMGVTVVIDHGSGYEGWYCSLSAQTPLSEGDTVEAGTVIGEVGTTAEAEISEPPHLHFGLKKNNAWVDPAEYLSGEGS